MSTAVSAVFVAAALAYGYVGEHWQLAVYALSFWHYYLYWLAYYFGAITPRVFRRDAVLMKTVSLTMLGTVYFATPLNLASLAVMGLGFSLNAIAAKALGAERTYYGYELLDLPPCRVTAFPYSSIAHPMLIGNIVAYGGTLLNLAFARAWWPLVATHIALNLGLLAMELALRPQRRAVRLAAGDAPKASDSSHTIITGACLAMSAAGLATTLGSHGSWNGRTLQCALLGACLATYAYAIYRCYAVPTARTEGNLPTTEIF